MLGKPIRYKRSMDILLAMPEARDMWDWRDGRQTLNFWINRIISKRPSYVGKRLSLHVAPGFL